MEFNSGFKGLIYIIRCIKAAKKYYTPTILKEVGM